MAGIGKKKCKKEKDVIHDQDGERLMLEAAGDWGSQLM